MLTGRAPRALVLWRDGDGKAVAMDDKCSHRAARLSLGKIRGGCLQCPFHGLRFDSTGRCVEIPANAEATPVPHALDMKPRPVREAHGLVWYWRGDPALATEQLPWFPEAPEPSPIARLAAKYDLDLVFSRQDMRMIASQQSNVTGDIAEYQLFEADRAIAMYFALRKRAIMDARRIAAAPASHAASA